MACCSLLAARKGPKVSELPAHLTIIIPKAADCQDNTREPERRGKDVVVASRTERVRSRPCPAKPAKRLTNAGEKTRLAYT